SHVSAPTSIPPPSLHDALPIYGVELEQQRDSPLHAPVRIAPGNDRQLVQDQQDRHAEQEPGDDRIGNEAQQLAEPKYAGRDLQHADEQDEREQPVEPRLPLQPAERL